MSDIYKKEMKSRHNMEYIRDKIIQHIETRTTINSAQDILKTIPGEVSKDIKVKMIQQALKHMFHMTYRRILKLSP